MIGLMIRGLCLAVLSAVALSGTSASAVTRASGTGSRFSLYSQVLEGMENLARAYPETVKLFDLGANDQGERIRGMRVGVGGRKRQLLVGAHHGNERLSADVAMAAARRLAEDLSDPASSRFGDLVSSEFYVIPVLNIGGYDSNRREERDSTGRPRDPNRDYPDPCATGKTDFRLKSTRLLARFVEERGVVGAVTVHGYIGTFTYPWGIHTDDSRTPDHDHFHSMGSRAVKVNGYRTGTHTDLIYPAAGAFEDWAYHAHGVWVMLLELRRNPDIARDAESLLTYFTAVPGNRSAYHEHHGTCRITPREANELPSRP